VLGAEHYAFLALTVFTTLVGGWCRIAAVRVIGPPLFGALVPWGLVVTTIFTASTSVLPDPVGPYNIAGVVVVVITLSVYLFLRYRSMVATEQKRLTVSDSPHESEDSSGSEDDCNFKPLLPKPKTLD